MGTHPVEPASMGTSTLRLFFALWPSSALRRALAVAAGPVVAQIEGQPVPAANLHVTLAFLGSVPDPTVAHLSEIGGQGGYPAIELDFDQLEYWPKPKVLVAMPSRVPPVGTAMAERLWQRIERLGFARDTRPWRPHLTLARKIRRPPPDGLRFGTGQLPPTDETARWGLALVESVTHPHGARYRPLAEWPLG
jgi:RNA 2',3'-cyclic 3'-phosphodiesterase